MMSGHEAGETAGTMSKQCNTLTRLAKGKTPCIEIAEQRCCNHECMHAWMSGIVEQQLAMARLSRRSHTRPPAVGCCGLACKARRRLLLHVKILR